MHKEKKIQRKTADKQKKSAILLRLMKMMKKGFFIYLAAIIIISFAMAAFQSVTAFILQDIITMAQTGDGTGLVSTLVHNVILGIAALLIYQVGFICYTLEAKKGCANLQNSILTKSLRLPYSYYENTHSGDFMSRIMYDSSRTEDVYGSRFRRVLMPFLTIIYFFVVMVQMSWQLTWCLFGVCAVTLIVNALFVRPMKRVSSKMSNTHQSLTENLSNILAGMEQVKMFALDKTMVEHYITENEKFQQIQKKGTVLSAFLEALDNGFYLLSSLVFIAVGIYFVSIGITTVGTLAAIYAMYGYMSWNFLELGRYIPQLSTCLVNAERVFAFLDLPEEEERYIHVGMPENDGYIVMEHVDFAYDKNKKVLEDFSLHIEQGKTVAIKGESGKGKSTIAKILMGFYPIEKGNISIAGKAFAALTLEEIRNLIGYVPQEPYLYDVSIAENIGYGKPGATMEEIVAAAKAANAHEFILKQEQGYDTIAGERGNNLSGGEKQRIAIARAILKNAPILILDEATSALDNESERLVSEALDRLMTNRTTIMIAHRLSTLERADVVVEI